MRFFLSLFLILIPFSISAQPGEAVVAADMCSLDSLFSDTALIRIEAGLQVSEEFGFRFPCTLVAERLVGGTQFWETGLFLEYHPFCSPLFLSLSLIQVGIIVNHPYEKENLVKYLHEMALGWQFKFHPSIVVEPRLVIKDPNRIFVEEYEELGSLFTRFPMVRFSLLVGWTFPVSSPKDAVK